MSTDVPLLSICIPTFNRAELLELCLATVLPQLTDCQSEVECVISDNASSDQTSEVIAGFAAQYPVKVFRNDVNIGIIANITKCASELAGGEFVMLIGDDDAVCIGAVARILKSLKLPDAPDLLALNVGYLPRSERPAAADAAGGVPAVTQKTLRRFKTEGVVTFDDLLEGPCADFTASYSVVIRRSLWKKHFPSACHDEPFTSVRTTYPSGYIIASTMPGRPAAALASPTIMIYEMPGSEYSWARYRALNSLIHFTLLLRIFEQNGIAYRILKPYYVYQLSNRGSELGDLLWNINSIGGFSRVLQFAWLMRRYPLRLLRMFIVAGNHPDAPRFLAACSRGVIGLKQFLRNPSE